MTQTINSLFNENELRVVEERLPEMVHLLKELPVKLEEDKERMVRKQWTTL